MQTKQDVLILMDLQPPQTHSLMMYLKGNFFGMFLPFKYTGIQQECCSCFHRYGECFNYETNTKICGDVLRLNVDYVYAKSSLGDQKTIARLLNMKITEIETVIDGLDEDCVKQVFRVLCHFYLPPCGNTTHPAPPSSICQEECQMVQENCQKTWTSVLLAFKADLDVLIECSDTSNLLFPVPHCCTGAGIGINLSLSLSHTHTHTYSISKHTLLLS